MAHRPFVAIVVCCCFVAASVRAQAATEKAEKPDVAAKQALLQRTLPKMGALSSCEFTAQFERTRLPDPRAANAGGAGGGRGVAAVAVAGPAPPIGPPMVIAGGWADGLLWASSNDDKYRMVWRGRRMIAQLDQKTWKLRQGVIGDGESMPRSFDPETFFAALARGRLELLAGEVGSLDDRPTEILTLHAAGEDAYELLWSGLLPDPLAPAWLGARTSSSAPGRAARVRPELDIDVAVWLDPALARAQQIKVRCYTRGVVGTTTIGVAPAAAGGVGGRPGAAAGGAPPADSEAPAAEPQAAAAEPLTFANCLPVRKPRGQEPLNVVSYDVRFSKHDAATPPALDAAARELLGLPPAK